MDGTTGSADTNQRRDSVPSVQRGIPDDHPVLQAFRRAPVVPGRASDEEREVFATAANGPWIPHEELMAEIEARRPR